MEQLFSQLGLDWHLLLSQVVNFVLLIVALWYFAYKPVLKILHDRQARIEEGLMKADEADRRLHEADAMKKQKIHEGETQALGILKKTETDAKELEAKMLAEARRKEAEELAATESMLRAKEEASRRDMEQQAAAMVRMAIAKTVELSPDKIDDALIARAVKEVAEQKPQRA